MKTIEINLKEKVQSMTASEIIMSMVEGLRNPVTKIYMATYGRVQDDVCLGCVATNTIAHLLELDKEQIRRHLRSQSNDTMGGFCNLSEENLYFANRFEYAIDELGKGRIRKCNRSLEVSGISARITNPDKIVLPRLNGDYTEEQLQKYVELAKSQEVMANITLKTKMIIND